MDNKLPLGSLLCYCSLRPHSVGATVRALSIYEHFMHKLTSLTLAVAFNIVCAAFLICTLAAIAPTVHAQEGSLLPNPLMLRNDGTGGDCTLVGIWDAGSKTCTLTRDIDVGIQIGNVTPGEADSITLDGAGHMLRLSRWGHGIYVYRANYITIENIAVADFSVGITVRESHHVTLNSITTDTYSEAVSSVNANNLTIKNSTAKAVNFGIMVSASQDLTISNVSVDTSRVTTLSINEVVGFTLNDISLRSTEGYGLYINRSSNGTIARVSTSMRHTSYPIDVYGTADAHYNHDIVEFSANGLPVYYYTHLLNETLDGRGQDTMNVYCAMCVDTTIQNYHFPTYTAGGIRLWGTERVTLANNDFGQPTRPIDLRKTSGTVIYGNRMYADAALVPLFISHTEPSAATTTFYRNSTRSYSPPVRPQLDTDKVSFSLPLPLGGNHWTDFDTVDEGCIDVEEDSSCDSPYLVPLVGSQQGVVLAAHVDEYPWTSPDAWDNTATPTPACADALDNDGDGTVDADDAACHSDLEAQNTASYDPSLTNENAAAGLFPELDAAVAQLATPENIPASRAPNLVVLVHGCCTDESDIDTTWNTLRDILYDATVSHRASSSWEFVVSDWHERSSLVTPFAWNNALANAYDQGALLGARIAAGNYQYVHLIGHSAGANVLASAIRAIRQQHPTDGPVIHATFLDAFAPRGAAKLYGEGLSARDFGEQYVRTGDLPMTGESLTHAYNFDVTDVSPLGLSLSEGHHFPIDFYHTSTAEAGGTAFGYPLSFESTNVATPSTHYAHTTGDLQTRWGLARGTTCRLTSRTECAAFTLPLYKTGTSFGRFETSLITGGLSAIQKSLTGLVELLQSADPETLLARMHTGSPVWFSVPITSTELYNVMTFDFDFVSEAGSEGVLTVWVDDTLVYKADERYHTAGTTTSPHIPLGDLAPGRHTLAFRLDAHTETPASVLVGGIELGRVTEEVVVDTTAPTPPTSLSATLATSSVTLTWSPATDSESGLAYYTIYRNGTTLATTSTTTYTDTGLTPATVYSYTVSATDRAGNESPQSPARTTYTKAIAKSVSITSSVSSVPTGTSATITWNVSGYTSCTKSGGWSGPLTDFTGSLAITPTTTTTYKLTCSAGGSTGSASAMIGVQ